jgi:citrate synthase/citryl-CoA lyase
MAAGVLSLSRFHGAAIKNAMTMLEDVVARVRAGESLEETCRAYLAELKANKQRASGIGHRLHTEDPRIEHLFRLCRECGVKGAYMATMSELSRQVTEAAGRPMTVNIDGGIAAVFCEIGFPKDLANALFILCRLTGITAQANEERTREKPMRKISPVDFEYDGPARRRLTER